MEIIIGFLIFKVEYLAQSCEQANTESVPAELVVRKSPWVINGDSWRGRGVLRITNVGEETQTLIVVGYNNIAFVFFIL